MHDLTGGVLRMPDDSEKFRCVGCNEVLMVRSGPDLMPRIHTGHVPRFVLFSAGDVIISCPRCNRLNITDGPEMREYPV